MPAFARVLLTLAVALTLASALTAQSAPRGPELQVNSTTAGHQSYADVGADPAGGFLVVWGSASSAGDPDHTVLGRRIDNDGNLVGGEIQLNTYTTGAQRDPVVAFNAGGESLTVWASQGSAGGDTAGFSIQGVLGSAPGSQFQVNTYTTGNQVHPAVAVLPGSGGFVVAWHSFGSAGSDSNGYSIQARLFDSGGNPSGGEFQVNTWTTSYQVYPAVAAGPFDDFVVAWSSDGSSGYDTSNLSLLGQFYFSDGTPRGGEIEVNLYTPNAQRQAAVAANAGGDFLVTWSSLLTPDDPSATSVRARLFASDGMPLATEVLVNAYTTAEQSGASVAATPGGEFVVVWNSFGSYGPDTSEYGVVGRRVGSDGMPFGGEFQVNSYTSYAQLYPRIDMAPDGGFVVAWHSYGSAGNDNNYSGYSVHAQVYEKPMFADGFESGDTSAWSVAVP